MVMILQSQSHKVNGRNASGDLTMRPKSSTVEDSARDKVCGDRTTFHNRFICTEQEAGTQSTSAALNTIWDIIRARGRSFLCSYHFIKFLLVDCPLYILRGLLHKLENGLIGRVSVVLGARLEDPAPLGT